MNIEIACLRCKDFFGLIPEEVEAFIEKRADKKYLERRKIPEQYIKYFRTRKNFIKNLIEYHCPYCREVVFSKPFVKAFARGKPKISETEYLKETEREMKAHGGFQFFSYKENEKTGGFVLTRE